MGTNLMSIIQKYTVAGSFLRELTDIIKRVNNKGEMPSNIPDASFDVIRPQ